MKTLIKSLAVVVLLSPAAFAKGNNCRIGGSFEPDSVYFQVLSNQDGIKVGVTLTRPESTVVNIYDSNRNFILSDKFEKNTVAKRYILDDSGTYYFVVFTGNARVEKKVTVTTKYQSFVSVN